MPASLPSPSPLLPLHPLAPCGLFSSRSGRLSPRPPAAGAAPAGRRSPSSPFPLCLLYCPTSLPFPLGPYPPFPSPPRCLAPGFLSPSWWPRSPVFLSLVPSPPGPPSAPALCRTSPTIPPAFPPSLLFGHVLALLPSFPPPPASASCVPAPPFPPPLPPALAPPPAWLTPRFRSTSPPSASAVFPCTLCVTHPLPPFSSCGPSACFPVCFPLPPCPLCPAPFPPLPLFFSFSISCAFLFSLSSPSPHLSPPPPFSSLLPFSFFFVVSPSGLFPVFFYLFSFFFSSLSGSFFFLFLGLLFFVCLPCLPSSCFPLLPPPSCRWSLPLFLAGCPLLPFVPGFFVPLSPFPYPFPFPLVLCFLAPFLPFVSHTITSLYILYFLLGLFKSPRPMFKRKVYFIKCNKCLSCYLDPADFIFRPPLPLTPPPEKNSFP